MPLHDAEKLSYLIGLCLAVDLLQIEHFGDRRMLENVMAPLNPIQTESKALDQVDHIAKSNVAKLATT